MKGMKWFFVVRGRFRCAGMIALWVAMGCQGDEAPKKPVPAASKGGACDAATGYAVSTNSYSPGRWRLAPDRRIEVLFDVSHITLRYDKALASSGQALIRLEDRQATRSRSEALTLADRLSAELREHPERFEEYAKRHSDDQATGPAGGALGTLTAEKLHDEFLDALEVLPIGCVSQPIETVEGVHLIRRNRVGAASDLAWSQIVIPYGDTPRVTDTSRRTRKQAIELASALRADIGARKRTFDEVARADSGDDSKLRGGDMGVWSAHFPGVYGRELHQVSSLVEGALSEPIDSREGIKLLRRDKVTKRPAFAAEVANLAFDPALPPTHPRSREHMLARAQALVKRAAADPDAVKAFGREACCVTEHSWGGGQQPARLEAHLHDVPVGGVRPEPIEEENAFHVIRRLSPPSSKERVRVFDLPSPEAPDMEYFVKSLPREPLAQLTDEIMKKALAAAVSDGPAPAADAAEDIVTKLAGAFTNARRSERVTLYREALNELKGALGAEAFQTFHGALLRLSETAILDGARRR